MHLVSILSNWKIRYMKLNQYIAQIISAPNINHFSTVEIRTAYLALMSDYSIDPNDARRFTYKELLKLVNNGWLRKTVSQKKRITSFKKTKLFDSESIEFTDDKNVLSEKGKTKVVSADLTNDLMKRLHSYKNELLVSLGETEEYKQLYTKFPELQITLQPQYNSARDKNSRLLGKIKAVENLIKENKTK